MISQKMIDWGSQGCGIREIAAYGEARAAVVGAENVFNFTIRAFTRCGRQWRSSLRSRSGHRTARRTSS